MGIFDRLRGKKEDVLPEEVEKYYQSQRRARVGTAWVLGVLTLIVTLFVAFGLFYGVRYAYRQITDSEDTVEVAPVEVTQDGATSTQSNESPKPKPNPQNKTKQQNRTAPRTGDTLPANGDGLPATGDPGL